MKYFVFIIICFFLTGYLKSQDTSKVLRIGMQCPSIVVTTSQNAIQSFNFPYNNKISLVHFWSSSAARSFKDFYKLSLIYNKYSVEPFRNAEGYDMITVALQSDRNEWQETLKKYQLKTFNNGIALKGFNDFYIKTFKLTEVPATILVDENGKIIAINPDVNTIITILDNKRDILNDLNPATKISGKIVNENTSSGITHQKVYLLNNADTILTTLTNDKGEFTFDHPNLANKKMYLHLQSNPDNLLLLNNKAETVSHFTKDDKNFEYPLSAFDLVFLRGTNIASVNNKNGAGLSESYLKEDLFVNGGFILDNASKIKIDKVLAKLKASPATRIDIITHTDNKGDAKANKDLSLKRSVAISNYLSIKGIAKSRIRTIGKGEEEPLNKCVDGVNCSETELKLNRRTDIKIYENE